MRFAKTFLPVFVVCLSITAILFFMSKRRGVAQSALLPAAGNIGPVAIAVPIAPRAKSPAEVVAASLARLDVIEAKAAEISEILSAVTAVESDWENHRINAEKYLERRNEIVEQYLRN